MAEALIAVHDLRRTYGRGGTAVHALRGIDLDVAAGQLLAVRGRSGSGKTTLLNLVGGLDRADGGRVHLAGQEVTAMRESELLELRRGTLAYVFQSFGLIPMLTAAENVGVPLRLQRMDPSEREERVAAVLALVGLTAHRNQRPGELSGGQQQRVALARALAPEPRVLLADEPTGQLDSQTGREIMDLIRQLVDEEGLTAMVATHDPALLGVADRVVELTDGRLDET
ncbi:ABC transporter ATP-binding protein [Georgenia yuyongxinii]|uniref:ABC transporter ATP-binding protein n=1 Tax=Georgenia yuyongxinii TaxID=2589797 RepID=A0A5B8BZX6_9MICO|nr:ABC transporter ATP-binding protein [Georgenia yuyongxinii]QDC23280.1 ABC transporter ATP-binding protein [Georgenia yuyongxinii]